MSDSPSDLELGPRLVAQVLAPMKEAFVGKDEVIDLLGVALVGGENLFLLGPPGTAKSALVHELGRRLHGETFEYLLTRFTEPGELFGPFDLRRLREGELITNTSGMLPEATLVFLDELLNANSAILNSLLTVLNERVFRRGRETRMLPTLMVVGASNRLPEDDALGALFDRFLLRVRCDNVAPDDLRAVLDAGWALDMGPPEPRVRIGIEEIRSLHALLARVDLEPVLPAMVELVHRLRHAGIGVTDRRAVKLQRMVAASALLCGRIQAFTTDLWVFRHVWETVEQQEVLEAIVARVLEPAPVSKNDHPRVRAQSVPDPECLARDLASLEDRLRTTDVTHPDRAYLSDRLGILAGRCQWVAGDEARSELMRRVEELWSLAGK